MKINYTKFVIVSTVLISLITVFITSYSIYDSEYYKLLFLLPLSNLFLLFTVNRFGASYLLSRISIMITVMFYFFKNVIVPLFLVLGDYSTYVPDNYLEYTSLAIALSVYEVLMISLILAINMKKLKVNETVDISKRDFSSKKFSKRIKLIVFMFFLYITLISYMDSTILRQTFMLMIGTPENWYIRTDYRELGAGGSGVLGVFATLVNTVFWMIQAIAPPIALNWVINNKPEKNQIKWTFFIAFIVLMVVTGTRIHALESSIAIIMVAISVYGIKIKKKLPPLAILGSVLVFVNLLQKSSVSNFDFGGLSKMFSSYFGGIQNISASIYAAKNLNNMNISLIPADIILKIPYIGNLFDGLFKYTSGSIFNYLIGGGVSSGQILPAIGQGYIYFGFLLAPIIPCVSLLTSINFEKKARQNGNLIYKNIYYIAAIMMARIAPSTNMMSGVQYLFYTYLTLFVAWFGLTRLKKSYR